nr:PEGA domain-containing protein [Candidatus Enterousia merdequi]
MCDWAKKTPSDDATYKYFVAQEFSTKSRSDAKEKAENNITQQICGVIGTFLSSATDSYESENISDSTSFSAQRSRCLGVYKQNFERIEIDTGRIDGEYVACVKYRYLKENLRQEQARITKEGKTSGSLALNEYIGNTKCDGHPIQITTNPAGALVSIDDKAEYSGRTPLRFGNVCNGSHELKITLEDYNTVTKTLDSKTKTVFETLKRQTKRISLRSNLENTKFTIFDQDGFKKKSGKGVLSYDFMLGIEYKISAKNDMSEEISVTKKFTKDDEDFYDFILQKLDGKIDFTIFKQRNADVIIYVDGDKITSNTTSKLAPDIEHEVVFEKISQDYQYEDIVKYITVTANQTFSYPSDTLEFKKLYSLNPELSDFNEQYEQPQNNTQTQYLGISRKKWAGIILGVAGAGGVAALLSMSGGGSGSGGDNNYNDCGYNAYWNGSSCQCNYGYENYQQGYGCSYIDCGYNAWWNGSSCQCNYGYENYKQGYGCSYIDCGYNAYWNGSSCQCDYGYGNYQEGYGCSYIDCGYNAYNDGSQCQCYYSNEVWTEGTGCSYIEIECGNHAYKNGDECVCEPGYENWVPSQGCSPYGIEGVSDVTNQYIMSFYDETTYGKYNSGLTQPYDYYGSVSANDNTYIAKYSNGDVYGIKTDYNYTPSCGIISLSRPNYGYEEKATGTIYIEKQGSGNVYGIHQTSSNYEFYNADTRGDSYQQSKGNIIINNDGYGDVYGIYSTQTVTNASNYSYGGDSTGVINIYNTNNDGNVYGIYTNENSIYNTDSTTITGNTSGIIYINNISDGNIYGIQNTYYSNIYNIYSNSYIGAGNQATGLIDIQILVTVTFTV